MPTEIAGYYWDDAKKRYFKIEQRRTAPSNAAWSSDSVKKRKLAHAKAAEKARQEELNMNRISRPETTQHPLIGGFLERELGSSRMDLIPASFAHGIVEKGAVEFSWGQEQTSLSHMVVTNRGPEGLCKIYASPNGRVCDSAYTLRDLDSGRIGNNYRIQVRDRHFVDRPTLNLRPVHEPTPPSIACIGYCEQIDATIIAPRQFQQPDPLLFRVNVDVYNPRAYSPATQPPADEPLVHIKTRYPWNHHFSTCRDPIEALSLCIAPATSNDLICVVGTTHGLVYSTAQGYMAIPFPLDHFSFKDPRGRPPTSDIFSITFQSQNPNVLLFGGRPGRLFTGDLRCQYPKWTNIRVRDAIAHVKQVNDHKVLVAGLRDMLSVFDMRYCKTELLHTKPRNVTAPLLNVDGYKNGPYLDLGLDFDRDSGVVAAAHDDGKVALYSVHSGRKLHCADVDKIKAAGPVKCLQWQTFAGDQTPSLFVGADHRVRVFSFGVKDPDIEE
ncbi:hypothetical protein F5Y11DRAFT_314305 [Daldinia sp. FL1419]|nr:hypothetical protein F5Y11DRAFT_314305 [Daldinia sp. FL1419]